jgi:hypothetical protein
MASYRFGAHIGSGGFGDVAQATQIDDAGDPVGPPLAVKRLRDELLAVTEAVERFRREVRYLDSIDHPNVMPVVARNLSASPPWFVMPRASGSLADGIAAGLNGSPEWMRTTFRSVLEGVAQIHDRGFVHRDLKPENVLFVDNVPRVSDLGLGKRLDASSTTLTQTNIGMGTLPYMAPEQFQDAANVEAPADVYALGKILGQMLTGAVPEIGRADISQFPAMYRSFIERCCADDPHDRYTTAADALEAFDLLAPATSDELRLSQEISELVAEWEEVAVEDDQVEVEAIVRVLVLRRVEEELYYRALPRLPRLLIEQMASRHPEEFRQVMAAYDAHIDGRLPFEYVDVAAEFLAAVLEASDDPQTQRIAARRLVDLGWSHNRWHVGEVLGRLVPKITDDGEALVVAEALRDDERVGDWYVGYLGGLSNLRPPLQRAIDEIRERNAE